MNLYQAAWWQQPLFLRSTVAPLVPFIAFMIAVLAFGVATDMRAHQELTAALASVPKTDTQATRLQYIRDYGQEVSLLNKLYATQSTTLGAMRALANITAVLPKTMRLVSVDFPAIAGNPITITAEVQSPQADVNEFLNRVAHANDHFLLSSLTPITNIYELNGNISVPWGPPANTNPPAAKPPTPAHSHGKQQKRAALSHPRGAH